MTENFIQQEEREQQKNQQQEQQQQQQYRQEKNQSELISATETVGPLGRRDDRRNKRSFSHRLVVPSTAARQESLVESTISTTSVVSSLSLPTHFDTPKDQKKLLLENRDVAATDQFDSLSSSSASEDGSPGPLPSRNNDDDDDDNDLLFAMDTAEMTTNRRKLSDSTAEQVSNLRLDNARSSDGDSTPRSWQHASEPHSPLKLSIRRNASDLEQQEKIIRRSPKSRRHSDDTRELFSKSPLRRMNGSDERVAAAAAAAVVVGLHRTSSSTSESIGSNNAVIGGSGGIRTRQRSNSMPRNIAISIIAPLPATSPSHCLRRSSTSARLDRRRSSMLSELLPHQSSVEKSINSNISLIVQMPDGRIHRQCFASNTLVRDVTKQLCETLTNNDLTYRLCLLSDVATKEMTQINSQQTVTFLDNTHRLIDIKRLQTQSIELSLIGCDRILSEWETLLIARCIGGNARTWLIDSPEVSAFVQSVAAEFQLASSSNNVLSTNVRSSSSTNTSLSFDDSSTLSHYDSDDVLTVCKLSTRLPIEKLVGLVELYVAFTVCYGVRSLQSIDPLLDVHCSTKITLQNELLQWNERIPLDVSICDLPREAYLDIRLCAKSNDDSSNVTIGSTSLQIFDHNGQLCRGVIHLLLWKNDSMLNIANVVLTLQFDTPTNPVFWKYRRPMNEDTTRQRISIEHLSPLMRSRIEQCMLVDRTLPTSKLSDSECRFIWQWRRELSDKPYMLSIVVRSAPLDCSPIGTVSDEIHSLLKIWSKPERPIDAIVLLGEEFVDIELRSWAVSALECVKDDELLMVLMQLIQSLKFESYHDSALARFLLRRAIGERRVGQQLFWLLIVELRRAITPSFATRIGLLLEMYLRIDTSARSSLLRQRELAGGLEMIARRMQSLASIKQQVRDETLRMELSKLSRHLSLSSTSFIECPLDCRIQLESFVLDRCKCLNKSSLLLVFETTTRKTTITVQFKIGEDLRQDMFILDVIRWMEVVWRKESLDLRMTPYDCLATGVDSGIKSISDSIGGMFRSNSLLQWLTNGAKEQRIALTKVVENFAHSCAGYFVASYVLGIADRQNDNVMLQPSGQLFHVGFSEILGNYKRKSGLLRSATPFVVTRDFENVIIAAQNNNNDDDDDDTVRSTKWQEFVSLGARAFDIVCQNAALFVTLFSLMSSARLPKLQSVNDLTYLEDVLISKDNNNDDVLVRWEKLIRQQSFTSTTITNLMQMVRNNNPSSSKSTTKSSSSDSSK